MGGALHIVLVGTSATRNTVTLLKNCASGDTGACDLIGLDMLKAQDALRKLYHASRDYCRQPPPGSKEDKSCGQLFKSDPLVKGALDSFIRNNPYAASAELNSMQGALESGCDCIGGILLLYTDTELGEASALALKRYLSGRCGVKVDAKRVPHLGTRFAPGLENLKAEIVRVAGEHGGPVALNLTGGFKPEGAAAALIGYQMSNIHLAYYRHEAFKETVVIPLTTAKTAGGVLSCVKSKRLSCASQVCTEFAVALCSVDPKRYQCSCGEEECPGPLVDSDLETSLRMLA